MPIFSVIFFAYFLKVLHPGVLFRPPRTYFGFSLPEKYPYLVLCSLRAVCLFWEHLESLLSFAFLDFTLAPLLGVELISGFLSCPTEGWLLLSCATCCHQLPMQLSQFPVLCSQQEPEPKPQTKQILLRPPDFCPILICAAFIGSGDQNPKCPQMTCFKPCRP